MQQPGRVRALDCVTRDAESASVVWLSAYRVSLLGGTIDDCMAPHLPEVLAASGYTHLILRTRSPEQQWFHEHPTREGLRSANRFADGEVFAVTAGIPSVSVAHMDGFFAREHDVAWTWRWMGADATWGLVNTSGHSVAATLDLELVAFHHARPFAWTLDDTPVHTEVVGPVRATYRIGPLLLAPGAHTLAFHAVDAPTSADELLHNGDTRPVSVAIGVWTWKLTDEAP